MFNNGLKVAVTGASGFVGGRLIQELIGHGAYVSILTRELDTLPFNSQKQITVFEGDLSDHDLMVNLVDNCSFVFHLAAYVHKPTVTKDQIEMCYEINYLGTKRLIDACLEIDPPPFFVFFSTVAVYGNIQGDRVESRECKPITKYGETKFAAEKYLLSKIRSDELKGCILRPCTIIGEHAPGNLSSMIKMIDLGVIPLFNGGENKKSMAYVDNVVTGAISIMRDTQISNHQIYNIADHNPLRMDEIIQIISSALKKRPLIINLPKKPFMFLSGLWDRFARLFNGLLPLIKRKLEVYTSEDVIISTKIQEQLGYQPKVTVEEAISRMASVYQRK